MLENIYKAFRHFKLHISLMLAVAFIILEKVHEYQNRFKPTFYGINTRNFENMSMKIFMFAIWLLVTILLVAQTNYSDKTGNRNFLRDTFQYRLTYWELLKFFKDADPYKLDITKFPRGTWREVEGVILGSKDGRVIRRRAKDSNSDGANYAVYAAPGYGKTACQIITSALRFGGSVFAIDIKGDILRSTRRHRRVKVFDPADASQSEHYNPLAILRELSPSKQRVYLERVAEILLPVVNNNESYFIQTAKTYFVGIAFYMLSQDANLTLPDIAEAVLLGNAVEWVKKIKDSDCLEAKEYTDSLYGSNEKNIAGAYGELSKTMRSYTTGDLKELLTDNGNCISPTTLEDGWDVYIEIPQADIALYSPIASLMVQDFMTSFMERDDNSKGSAIQPVLFLLDELPQLKLNFETFQSALSTLRSKGISVYYACQSIGQLINKWGEAGARLITDTTTYISIMSAQDPTSRKFFSDLIGTKKTLKVSHNISGSEGGGYAGKNLAEVREPIFRPEDFGDLNDKVIIYARGKYVVADKTYYFK